MTSDIPRVVLVVGGSSSVGLCICDRFLRLDTQVIATYKNQRPSDSTGNIDWVHLDLASETSINELLTLVSRRVSKLDVVIMASGLLPGKSLGAYKFQEMEEVVAVNFTGQAKSISLLLPMLNSGASILMFSSISAQRGSFDPIYAASKSALHGFVKSLAVSLPEGVRINAIAPGLIEDSSMFEDMSPDRQDFHRSQIPSGALLQQSDLANIVFDVSQAYWKHLNGACIDLNGGQYVR